MNPHKIFRFFVKLIIPLLADVEVHGQEKLPQGGFILAMNHLGRLDAYLLHLCIEDRNDFAVPVAEKYEKHPFYGWLGRQLGVVWVDRYNADYRAVRRIIQRMQDGAILAIAPEGTRSRTEALIEGKPGVAFLAARAGVPVMPVAITGTEDRAVGEHWRRFKRPKIVIRGGDPFLLEIPHGKNRDEALKTATDEIMCRIAALLPEKYRGVYSGHPRLKELLDNA